jgi:hypothetical protein
MKETHQPSLSNEIGHSKEWNAIQTDALNISYEVIWSEVLSGSEILAVGKSPGISFSELYSLTLRRSNSDEFTLSAAVFQSDSLSESKNETSSEELPESKFPDILQTGFEESKPFSLSSEVLTEFYQPSELNFSLQVSLSEHFSSSSRFATTKIKSTSLFSMSLRMSQSSSFSGSNRLIEKFLWEKNKRKVISDSWLGYFIACCLVMTTIIVGYVRLMYDERFKIRERALNERLKAELRREGTETQEPE